MRCFIVHTTPKCFVEKYKSSISGSNFSYNLKEAGLFDKVFSILPTNIYAYEEELDIDDIHIVYSRIRSKNRFARVLGCLVEQWRMFKMIEQGSEVWLYNICVLNFLLFILLKLFKKSVGVYVVLADFTPSVGANRTYLKLINVADGLIALSNSSLFTVKNSVILPGIVPTDVEYPEIKAPIERSFLLSGALRECIASTTMVLNTFKEVRNGSLHISGRYEDIEKMKQFEETCDNIKYYGVLPFDDFKKLLDGTPFCLSTRNPSYPENQCNFPSKVLEALLHNRIIISTIHYPQLDGIKYFEVPCEGVGFGNALAQIILMDDSELMVYANQSSKIKQMYSPVVWLNTIEQIEKTHRNGI